jgi:hypothetical protein
MISSISLPFVLGSFFGDFVTHRGAHDACR